MKITVRYFALLRERAGRETEVVAWDDPAPTLRRFRDHLAQRSPALGEALGGRPVLCAVNQEYAAGETLLREGDEVAFFPPVTGG